MGKLVLNSSGIQEMLKSQEIQDVLASYAQSFGGNGNEVSVYVGKTRANVSVRAVTDEAKQDNLSTNSLLKGGG